MARFLKWSDVQWVSMEELVQWGLGILATLLTSALIGGVVYVRGLRKQVHELEKKVENLASKESIENVRLQMKELEGKDALQQQTLDQLPALLPLLKKVLDIVEKDKKR